MGLGEALSIVRCVSREGLGTIWASGRVNRGFTVIDQDLIVVGGIRKEVANVGKA
jgi:hypothetical protein